MDRNIECRKVHGKMHSWENAGFSVLACTCMFFGSFRVTRTQSLAMFYCFYLTVLLHAGLKG